MKVLIFDDSEVNRNAAVAQLKSHELTVVSSYDEAAKLLTPKSDTRKECDFLEARCPGGLIFRKNTQEWKHLREVREETAVYPDYEVFLTDLIVPPSANKLVDGREHLGKEGPYGIFLGLYAAVNARIKRVGVFTDRNHHDHPASTCLDAFSIVEGWDVDEPLTFKVRESQFVLTNNWRWINWFDPADLSKEVKRSPSQPAVRAKNWLKLLDYLLEQLFFCLSDPPCFQTMAVFFIFD